MRASYRALRELLEACLKGEFTPVFFLIGELVAPLPADVIDASALCLDGVAFKGGTLERHRARLQARQHHDATTIPTIYTNRENIGALL